MIPIGLIKVLAAVLLIKTVKCQTTSYKELQELGVACPPYDSCNATRDSDTLQGNYCVCQSRCADHDTCCIDSPYADLSRPIMRKKRNRGTCTVLKDTYDVKTLVVSRCGANWMGDQFIKEQCEQSLSWGPLEDPLQRTPVTNIKSMVTYSNYFCAVCNGDDDEDSLKFFKIEISMPSWSQWNESDSELLEKMTFDQEKKHWGVMIENHLGQQQFERLTLVYVPPANLSLPECIENMVSECHPRWYDNVVRQKCGAYMARLSVPRKGKSSTEMITYRNIHCALCNFATYEKGKLCFQPTTAFGGGFGKSFTLLLDINLSDGDKVGEVNPCPKGEIYDSFFSKCRTLKCVIPGRVMKGDKCVKA